MADGYQQRKLNLATWEALFKAIELGSISRASRQCNIERSQLSRLISSLEDDVGCKLIERVGRTIRPTQVALHAMEQIKPIILRMRNVLTDMPLEKKSQSGNIRFGAMPGFLQTQVVPLIAEFQQMHPMISFDVIGDDDPRGIMQGQSDLMLYYGPVNNPNIVEHWVTRSAFIPCAAPSYIATHGAPHEPEDLEGHAGVIYTGKVRPHSSLLTKFGENRGFSWKSKIRFNNILLAKAAAIEGCGVVLDMPLHHCINEILRGQLVPVLDGWHIPNLDNYIGSTKEAARLYRVQLFVNWYIERRRTIEGEQKRRIQEKYSFVLFD